MNHKSNVHSKWDFILNLYHQNWHWTFFPIQKFWCGVRGNYEVVFCGYKPQPRTEKWDTAIFIVWGCRILQAQKQVMGSVLMNSASKDVESMSDERLTMHSLFMQESCFSVEWRLEEKTCTSLLHSSLKWVQDPRSNRSRTLKKEPKCNFRESCLYRMGHELRQKSPEWKSPPTK